MKYGAVFVANMNSRKGTLKFDNDKSFRWYHQAIEPFGGFTAIDNRFVWEWAKLHPNFYDEAK